jgi:uncharacterized membrane protein YfcA
MQFLSTVVGTFAAGFADLSMLQLVIVAAAAFVSGVMSCLAGYGVGLIMPLVLVPIVGPEPVVPVAALSGLFLNMTRVVVFFRYADWRRSLTAASIAAPTCALGAYGFTFLTGKGILLLIGTMLLISVPLRYLLKRLDLKLSDRGLWIGSFFYGGIFGATPGAGVIMVSMMMATGVHGTSVLATDSLVSMVLVTIKSSVFFFSGAVTPLVMALALVTGLSVLPTAFIARTIMLRLPVHIHTAMLDAMVSIGGAVLIVAAFR